MNLVISKSQIKSSVRSVVSKSQILSNIYFERQVPIKIHGTLRVGSNYLKKLLEINYEGQIIKPNEFGWKHGKIKYSPHFKYIVISRSPLSWVNSFWNWEKIHERTCSNSLYDFLSSDVTHPQLKSEWNAINPIDAWNKTYEAYADYLDLDNVVFIRYEDLISDFARTIEYLGSNISLTSKVDRFINYYKRADDWKKPNPQQKMDVNYYKSKKYLAELDEQSVAFMQDKFNSKLIKKMGYSLL